MVSTSGVARNGTGPGLPEGKYKLVGFDMDLTGRRLIDEIVHVGAFTPTSTFTQYVMPFRNLNLEAKYRHLLRIITVGRYRMLKSDKTSSILKTKSEISALTDFVQWLESLESDSIILLTHETVKTVPLFLLEVLKKYNLYERFCKVVKGFANTYLFAEAKCAETVKSYSLFSLCTVLLDKNEDLDNALDRARLTYEILQHLCAGEDGSGDAQTAAMTEAIRKMANSITAEEEDLEGLKLLVERQNSLRPIFGIMIKSRDRFERYRAGTLRRLIAAAFLTYSDLEAAFKEGGRESLTNLVKEKVTQPRKPEDLDDLLEMLYGHFETGYVPKLSRNSKKNKTGDASGTENDKENAGDKSKTSSGKSSPGKFASATSSPVKTAPAQTPAQTEVKDADMSR